MNSLKLKKKPYLEYPTAYCKLDSCGSHSTVAGHVTSVNFLLSDVIQTMLLSNKIAVILITRHLLHSSASK